MVGRPTKKAYTLLKTYPRCFIRGFTSNDFINLVSMVVMVG
jgi:hypothetical protein